MNGGADGQTDGAFSPGLGGQGYLVSVRADELIVERLDFAEGGVEAAPAWTVPLPAGRSKALSDGVRAAAEPVPAFPAVLDETGTLRLTYATPKLELTSFDASTGAVRFKVTPGEGNQIVSSINNGYIHVYGTSNLGEKMRYISSVGFDLSPYLKAETKGEGVLNITLGTHTFLKVKIESCEKTNGEIE